MFSIGDSVFVTENSNGAANAGVIIGNKGVVIVDSTFFPVKMKRIAQFVHSVTGRMILYVVNTHYHLDHTLGNCALDVPVIGSALTKKYVENFDLESFKNSMEPFVQRELEGAKLVPPSVTFKNKMSFDLGDRKLEILRLGGHTPDSSIVFVLPERVCFCGDLVFNGYHAEIEEDADLDKWVGALKRIKKMEPKWVVPGHGRVCGVDEVDKMAEYIEKFKEIFKLVDLKRAKEVIDEFGEDPVFAERGFALLFEESLLNYVRRRGRHGKNLGAHKT